MYRLFINVFDSLTQITIINPTNLQKTICLLFEMIMNLILAVKMTTTQSVQLQINGDSKVESDRHSQSGQSRINGDRDLEKGKGRAVRKE